MTPHCGLSNPYTQSWVNSLQHSSVDLENSENFNLYSINPEQQNDFEPSVARTWLQIVNNRSRKSLADWGKSGQHQENFFYRSVEVENSMKGDTNTNAEVSARTCSLSLRSDTTLWEYMTQSVDNGGLGYVCTLIFLLLMYFSIMVLYIHHYYYSYVGT